jgi:hypothetical protein
MALVSLVPAPSYAAGLHLVLEALHMLGFLICIGVLLYMELKQLRHIERAVARWPPWRYAQRAARRLARARRGERHAAQPAPPGSQQRSAGTDVQGAPPSSHEPLEWDQTMRCWLVSGEIVCMICMVMLQTPLTLGVSGVRLALASVLAEVGVGACAYAVSAASRWPNRLPPAAPRLDATACIGCSAVHRPVLDVLPEGLMVAC